MEQELVQMVVILEKGIDAIQTDHNGIQERPHNPSETTILIQAAQSQLAALASSIMSPSKHQEVSLH